MTKWEYVSIALVKGILDAGVKTQEDLLNKYGLDGWELVSIVALQINQSFEVVAYLKRELRNQSILGEQQPKITAKKISQSTEEVTDPFSFL